MNTASWLIASTLTLSMVGCATPGDTGAGGAGEGGNSSEDVGAAELALGGECSHDKCTEGAPLSHDCGQAVAAICDVDPYCCDVGWDGLCVHEVQSVTNSLVCTSSQGTCDHTLCSPGEELVSGCDSPPLPSPGCVSDICAVDPYCCDFGWDRICVQEVETVCGENCDLTACDLDGDGDPSFACGGQDHVDTCDETVTHELTACGDGLMGWVSALVATINAQEPLETRTAADLLSCPADQGVGEAVLNIFSYVGPLPKGCNRIWEDDCNDPERSSFWLSVVDDRRPGHDPHRFGLIWGDESHDYVDYYYYGSCPPIGFDNPAVGVPKLLSPRKDEDGNFFDVNGDGTVDGTAAYPHCAFQTHVHSFRFWTPDGNGGRDYIEKDNMAHVSSPYLLPEWLPIPTVPGADYAAEYKGTYVAVDITLKAPAGETIIGLVESVADTPTAPAWIQWKQPTACAAP